MRIRSRFIRLLCLVACVNLTISLSSGLAADFFSSIAIPVFHSGYDIKKEVEMVDEKGRDELAVRCQLLPTPALSTSQKADNTPQKAPVMLAQRWDQKIDINGWWMSEKLDGVRGYWTGKEMISRSGNPFRVPEWFTRNFPLTPLDGELWIGQRQFFKTCRHNSPEST